MPKEGDVMRHIRTLSICLVFFLLYLTPVTQAATEQRIALVIGNSTYSSGPLKNPVNDATDMAATLKKLGFTVTLKKNARMQEMEEAIEELGNRLKRGGVGLFYYAGHGVQVNGMNYLLPVGAKINKESDVRFQAVDAGKVLAEMENANNGLNIVILDACRDNPLRQDLSQRLPRSGHRQQRPRGDIHLIFHGCRSGGERRYGKEQPLYLRTITLHAGAGCADHECLHQGKTEAAQGNGSGPLGVVFA
jgi:hypothetical protein